jgi:hypothetical protein
MSAVKVGGNNNTLHISFEYGGLFCNTSLILQYIISYLKHYTFLPKIIITSGLFNLYKSDDKKIDLRLEYFKNHNDIDINYDDNVEFETNFQFINYKNINYTNLDPFITKYFSVTQNIQEKIKKLETKYNIDYSKICVLFYRGLDKCKETKLCSYTDIIEKANTILTNNPTVQFLIQSDEAEFIHKMEETFPNNSICFKDEIRYIPKCMSTVVHECREDVLEYSKWYLAITLIMSKCKYIICTTGNCSIWIMLYRGNANHVNQYLDGEWV